MTSSPSVLKTIFLASRPKTWVAGFSPVLIGTALAFRDGPCLFLYFLCSLLFSLFIQIGTNFANDAFDFLKGADTEKRVGPPRAVAQGWISPESMKAFAFLFFGAAFAISLPLVFACGAWALLFVFSSIAFGILYTGGPRPLGYLGLGELLVLLYYGPVAVIGTYFVQRQEVTFQTALMSLAPGFFSAAILIANNLRDEHTDRACGKNTLVVRFGREFGKWEYVACLALGALVPLQFGYSLPFLLGAASVPLLKLVFNYQEPKEIISLLPKTALLLALFTLLFCFEALR